MSVAAALLDRLGRPGDIRLGLPLRGGHPHLPTGIDGLDHVLGGGLPRGRLIELAGRRSTGRTGLACTIAARATRHGEIVGWVDPADALDPETVLASGIAPTRVLWVRPRSGNGDPSRGAAAGASTNARTVRSASAFGVSMRMSSVSRVRRVVTQQWQ